MNDKIKIFLEINKNLKVGTYCVLVYINYNYGAQKIIKYIYKDLDRFKEKIEKDLSSIDSKYGIDFQIWIFD